MGALINPSSLSQSGERCLARLVDLQLIELATPQVFAPIATAVEVHVSAMLARLVVLSDVESTPFGSALLNELQRDLARTWYDRYRWLNQGFDLPLAGDLPAQQFGTLTEVRNSMIHGDGQISDDQQSLKLSKLVALKAEMKSHLNVTADGRLRFGPNTRMLAFGIARAFVEHFDKTLLKKYPSARTL